MDVRKLRIVFYFVDFAAINSKELKKFWGARVLLNWLLIFIPITLGLEYFVHPSDSIIFISAALAIVPIAANMGQATENLATKIGPTGGGLLNATFGNATELIIAFFALQAGKPDVVKASITGSMIGNMLAVVIDPISGVTIFSKGDEIQVGAGCLSHAQRMYYFDHQDEFKKLIHKGKFFPKGIKDKPRFPTWQTFRTDADIS